MEEEVKVEESVPVEETVETPKVAEEVTAESSDETIA